MRDKDGQPLRRIVWPLAIAELIVWAAMYYSFPALLAEWERDLGWSKTELSGAFTAALVIAACLAPITGWLIDRRLGRVVFSGCTVLGALLLALFSQVEQLWQFYCLWIVMGVAMAGALYEACFALLTRTLGSDARRAITQVALVAGFAGTVAFPAVHVLTDLLGWRGAMLVLAAAVIVGALPLFWYACGVGEKSGAAEVAAANPRLADAIPVTRSITFWLVALCYSAIALDHGALFTHILPMLGERGFSEPTAVFAASMIGPMQVAGRLIALAVERRVSPLGITLSSLVAMGVAALSLLGSSAAPVLLGVFVFFQGAGYGVTSIVRPVVTAELLGRRNFGVISGFLAIPFLGMAAAAPTVAAILWTVGGYDAVILLAIAAAAVGFLAITGAAIKAGTKPPPC
jgi:MFS family permease